MPSIFNKSTRYSGHEINRKYSGRTDHRPARECETAEIRKMTTSTTNNKDAVGAMEYKKISWITPDEIDDKQITFPPPLTDVAVVEAETGSKRVAH